MNNKNSEYKSKVTDGKIEGTSAFNIKQAHELREISWSNNNSASAHLEAKECSNPEQSQLE